MRLPGKASFSCTYNAFLGARRRLKFGCLLHLPRPRRFLANEIFYESTMSSKLSSSGDSRSGLSDPVPTLSKPCGAELDGGGAHTS